MTNTPDKMLAALESMEARWGGYDNAKEEIRTGIAELTARAEAAEARVAECGPKLLSALALQFDEMSEAAGQDDEYDRRDVWRDAASQARWRADDAAWIDAAIDALAGQPKGDG
jgi:hypothetical protein